MVHGLLGVLHQMGACVHCWRGGVAWAPHLVATSGGGVGVLVEGRHGMGPSWRCANWVRREIDSWGRRGHSG